MFSECLIAETRFMGVKKPGNPRLLLKILFAYLHEIKIVFF
jgi:hypothetical protein